MLVASLESCVLHGTLPSHRLGLEEGGAWGAGSQENTVQFTVFVALV